jgi:hypothetical protein
MFALSCICCTGAFNTIKGTYDFTVTSNILDTYMAIITIRHPNVSTSFSMARFYLSISPPPVSDATATPANGTNTASAASVVLFNPLVNPRLLCLVTLPRMTASTYNGGSSKLLSDFNTIVASNAVLDSPSWVQSMLTGSSSLTINTTVS